MNKRSIFQAFLLGLFCMLPTLVGAQGKKREIKEVPVLGEENMEGRWAVVIGLSNYKLSRLNLHYAAADATEFAETLVKHCGFQRDRIKMLLNEQATATNIRTALGTWLPRVAGRRDLVVIYYAGHGSPDLDKSVAEDGIRKYLVCYDAEPKNLYGTAVPMEELNSALLRLRSERTVVLLDCCFSGAAPGASATALPRTVFQSEVKGRPIKDGFISTLASTGAGRMVMTASAPNETSQEYADIKHGLFTYHLMQGLAGKALNNQGEVTPNSLYEYVSSALANPGQNRDPQTVVGSTSLAGKAFVLAGKGLKNNPNTGNGTLEVHTSPLGAEVFIDNKPPMKSPVNAIPLSSGPHKVVILKRGYQAIETEIFITPGNTSYQSFVLNVEKTNGDLIVRGPEGAEVKLDGKSKGRILPSGYFRIEDLEAGAHTLTVAMEGRAPIERTTIIPAGALRFEDIELKKELAGRRGVGPGDIVMGLAEKNGRYFWNKDSSEMVFVSDGPFWMGSDTIDDARPRHEENLPAFWIDRTEVTNEQFAAFVRALSYKVKGDWTPPPAGQEKFPATSVTLEDARNYARWAGKILPTEAMWEKACRSTDERLYPYGETFNRLFQNIRAYGFGGPLEVGTLAQGASPYGALDMLGNVAEWCDSKYVAYPGSPVASPNFTKGHYVVRGGGYRSQQDEASGAARSFLPPGNGQKDVGFRCAVMVQ